MPFIKIKKTPTRTYKTCIRLAACMEYVRDYVGDEATPKNEVTTKLKKLVGAFDKVVIRRLQLRNSDSALWNLCNELEEHIGRAPNVAEALRACVLIIKRETKTNEATHQLLPAFKQFEVDADKRVTGKIMKFLGNKVKIES